MPRLGLLVSGWFILLPFSFCKALWYLLELLPKPLTQSTDRHKPGPMFEKKGALGRGEVTKQEETTGHIPAIKCSDITLGHLICIYSASY